LGKQLRPEKEDAGGSKITGWLQLPKANKLRRLILFIMLPKNTKSAARRLRFLLFSYLYSVYQSAIGEPARNSDLFPLRNQRFAKKRRVHGA
jgi:hypothetical protein